MTRGKLEAATAGLAALDRLAGVDFADDEVSAVLREEYERRIAEETARLGELERDYGTVAEREREWARRQLLLPEKNQIIDAFQEGVVSQRAYQKLLRDVDERLRQFESGQAPTADRE